MKTNKEIEDLNKIITNPENWSNINLINKSQEKLKQIQCHKEFDFVSNQFKEFKEFIEIYESLNDKEINELVKIYNLKNNVRKLKLNLF